jgi:N-alpha-acetyltransferase 15/16, NatA auxiliary subunit
MKALIINAQGNSDEAFKMAKHALELNMKSSICWHVYGLLYRHAKNYEEAVKAYKFALRLDPESWNILRDLAQIQIHLRDYSGYVVSRRDILRQRSSIRQNWTALAIAHHLAGDFAAAEHVLTTFEGTLKNPPPRSDIEHSEALLYKNTIIAESGDLARALEHLETIFKTTLDRTAVMEMRADYLLRLDRKEEAQKAYQALLERNSEYRLYYESLERALGINREDQSSWIQLEDLYNSYASKNDRLDAPHRIPLDFLHGTGSE